MKHTFKRCTRKECDHDCDGDGQIFRFGHVSGCAYVTCGGCRPDTGMDCTYEALSCCEVCDCYEGSLLPFCPGRRVSYDESQAYYEHYCAGTGPFARRTFKNVLAADLAAFNRLYTTSGQIPSEGQKALRVAIGDLLTLSFVCAICSGRSGIDVGGVVEPAHEWICNSCLVGRFCP